MVDLEDVDRGEPTHAPGPSVEAGSGDHDVGRRPLGNRIVDRHRARHHDLRVRAQHLELDAVTPGLGGNARAGQQDRAALVLA
jgi:hypothetical protein